MSKCSAHVSELVLHCANLQVSRWLGLLIIHARILLIHASMLGRRSNWRNPVTMPWLLPCQAARALVHSELRCGCLPMRCLPVQVALGQRWSTPAARLRAELRAERAGQMPPKAARA